MIGTLHEFEHKELSHQHRHHHQAIEIVYSGSGSDDEDHNGNGNGYEYRGGHKNDRRDRDEFDGLDFRNSVQGNGSGHLRQRRIRDLIFSTNNSDSHVVDEQTLNDIAIENRQLTLKSRSDQSPKQSKNGKGIVKPQMNDADRGISFGSENSRGSAKPPVISSRGISIGSKSSMGTIKPLDGSRTRIQTQYRTQNSLAGDGLSVDESNGPEDYESGVSVVSADEFVDNVSISGLSVVNLSEM